MTVEAAAPRSRRSLLAGALGAAAATVATALGRPANVRASDPNDVVLGAENAAANTTVIYATTEGFSAFWGSSLPLSGTGTGVGVRGSTNSSSGIGVWGESDIGVGVKGSSTDNDAVVGNSISGTGVTGFSSTASGVFGYGPTFAGVAGNSTSGAGVLGQSSSGPGVQGFNSEGWGVYGQTESGQGVRGTAASGIGVRGFATSGIAASFETTSGLALVTRGRVRFQQIAGKSSLAAGQSSVTVSPGVDLTSGTSVLATLNGNPGTGKTIHRVAINTAANTFTIYLTSASTSVISVAWFVLEQ